MSLRFEPRVNYLQQSGLAHYFLNTLTNKNNAKMQRPNHKSSSCRESGFDSAIISKHKIYHHQNLHSTKFIIGDLYLFHPMKKYCPARSSLWGIYDKTEDGIIYLESSTLDLIHFRIWHRLPDEYRYARRATRQELRDYMYNLGYRYSQIRLSHTNRFPIIYPRSRHSYLLDMHNA